MKTQFRHGATSAAVATVVVACAAADDSASDTALMANSTPTGMVQPNGVPGPTASGAAMNPVPAVPLPGPEAPVPEPAVSPPVPPAATNTPPPGPMPPAPVPTPAPVEVVGPGQMDPGGTAGSSQQPGSVSGAGGSSDLGGPTGGSSDPGDALGGSSDPGDPAGGAGGDHSEPASQRGEAQPSAGCGMQPPAPCEPCQANGLDYYVDMPSDYDPSRPYPVVFQYHPLGGSGQQARTMYRVRPDFPDAIYVSPDGSDNGFPNQGGEDEEVTRAIIESIEATLCIDTSRYFATGFSYGGSMSFTAGCNMSDKFRAIAPMAGAPISGARCTSQAPERPVAVLAIHGEQDTALPITMAEPIIEAWLEKNGCTTETQPTDLLDSICARAESALEAGAYQGCTEGYPVIWCPMPDRPHEIPGWSGAAIATFFRQF